MKKNVLKIALFAFGLCAATTMTSCHSGEDVDIVEVPQLEARTLQVFTNGVIATVNVNGQTLNSDGVKVVEFANPAKTGTIVVTPTSSDRQAKTISYDFKDGAMLYYDVTLESAGTVYSQAAVETGGATVSNGTANQGDNGGVEASFALNGETNNGTTGDYSITVYDPAAASTNAEDLAQGQTYLEAPLAIDCKPDGANFSNPIKVKLNIPGSDGLDIKVKADNTDEEATFTRNGDEITANIPHFSVWNIILNVECADVTTEVVSRAKDKNVDAKVGQTTVSFPYGFEYSGNSVLVKNFLKGLFGSPIKNVNKKIKWTPTEGTAIVNVDQTVKTYKFASNGKVVATVTVYGKITSSVVVNPAEVTPTHGGGSN